MYSRLVLGSIRRSYSTSAPEGLSAGELNIYNKLSNEFKPIQLRVADVSGGCGSMYAIEIVSKAFEGKSMVKQHRLVNDLLKQEIKDMHGLQLRTSSK
ncbi:bola-like protein [Hesseltinella vesiculosa]|uniref:Bola-like protein n=1 Tax=Hesseltinella vesiculosa TaxID=101127 RepID=A0A1X2GA12_9FUNG|nr:bola-like protein [Hesseltinella vesiculosa]